MKRWLSGFAVTLLLASASFAKGPEIQIIDNKLSVNVESVSLGRLLRLLDLATGMKSRIPPELANRNISAKFSDLDLDDGVRKMFQGQPVDYVVIAGQGIVVTAPSQSAAGSEPVPVYTPPVQVEQPFVQDFAPPPPPNQQPATIQTPFGMIANPRAGQPMPAAPNAPLSAPGAQNSLFPQAGQQPGTPQQQQPMIQTPFGPIGQPAGNVAPSFPGGAAPANPFNSPSPFGTTPQQQNNLFNSGAAPMFQNQTPTPQQRTP